MLVHLFKWLCCILVTVHTTVLELLLKVCSLLKFTETGLELGDNLSKVIAPQDVAVYGGLCALASFDRSELKSKVIDNDNFHHFLELVPEVKELINDFYACRYASCMGYLEELKPNLLLDIYMHEHVETIYKEIRHEAIIHYTLPFISVDLNRMAPEFKTSVPLLEKELAALITENKIQARIDSHNKILYAMLTEEMKLSSVSCKLAVSLREVLSASF